MNGTIYMRISPTGKRYIGQTTKPEIARWKQHVSSALNKHSSEWKTPLSASIRKHGGESFSVVILETGIDTIEELNEREIYWIKEYHTLIYENQNGLNVTIGGDGYRKYKYINFQELYDKGYSIGEIAKMTSANPSTVSSYVGSDRIENCRRSRLNSLKKNPPRSVSCYNPETCEKIKTFDSTGTASSFFIGQKQSSYITNAISGKVASAFGYLWKYDDQPMDVLYARYDLYHNPKNNNTRGRKVVNVETGEIFKSALSASKAYNVSRNLIVSCCKGMRENAGGYHWHYDGEEIPVYKGTHAKPIICIDTNIIYPSVSEASRQTKIPINKITECLKGRREHSNGLHWEYKNKTDKESGKFKNSRFKSIICVETGVIYETMEEAAHKANVTVCTLRRHLRNSDNYINGFHWDYVAETGF